MNRVWRILFWTGWILLTVAFGFTFYDFLLVKDV